jgi:hypothetical protein
MNYVYKIHALVDDKLEHQRIDRLFETISLSSEVQDQIRNNFMILSPRPTFQVVMKRWELSEDKLFSPSSVWRVLFSFVMLIDTDEESQKRRDCLRSWISSLSIILQSSLEYKHLSEKLNILQRCLPQYMYSSRQGFIIIALARESLLRDTPSENDLKKYKESEKSWLKPLWSIYKHNLPAGSCGRFTCS